MIIHSGNIEKWFFDYVEGNLTTLELKELENFVLEHPEFQDDFRAWKESVNNKEEEIPVFTPMSSLYAVIPFYETITFKVVSAFILLFATFSGGMYIANIEDLVAEYHSNQLEEELVAKQNVNFAQPLFNVLLNSHTNYKVKNSQHLYKAKKNDLNPNLINNIIISKDVINEKMDKLAIYFVENENLQEEYFTTEDNELFKSLNKNDKSLNEILERKSRKYAFLDFKNKDGFGISNKKLKDDNSKKDIKQVTNLAAISEGTIDGGKANKKRKKLFDNLKYIELGLGNINDPIFISPNYNTVKINPSLSGELGFTRVESIYRNQWTGAKFQSSYGSVYGDTYFSKLKAGMSVGVNYLNSLNGGFKNVEMNYSYVQKIKLTKDANLSVGATYSLTSINAESELGGFSYEVTNGSYLNMNSYIAKSGKYISNAGLSSWYSGKFFYGGFNVTNLLNTSLMGSQESDVSYINGLDYTMQIGTDYRKSIYSNTVLSPYVVLQKEGTKVENWGGVTFRHKAIILGLSGSDDLSAKGIIGFQGNSLRLLYGYDLSKSDYNKKYIGSHEVSLRILFGNKTNSNWSRYGN